MSEREALLVFMPAGASERARAIHVRGDTLSECVFDPQRAEAAMAHVVLVLPAGMVCSRRYAVPDLPPVQAEAVARRWALDAAIGGENAVYAVAMPAPASGAYDVVTIARDDLSRAIGWSAALGLDPDVVLPVGALLPNPAEGLVAGSIAGQKVIRGCGIMVPADEAFVAAVLEEQTPTELDAVTLQNALLAALFDCPANLRTGAFAKRPRRPVERAQWLRIGLLLGAIALVVLCMALVKVVKLNRDSARLDAMALAKARTIVPDAPDAEAALSALRALSADGGGSFSAMLAILLDAMQTQPGVTMLSLDRGVQGDMRASLTGADNMQYDALAKRLRDAGYRADWVPASNDNGRPGITLTVQP